MGRDIRVECSSNCTYQLYSASSFHILGLVQCMSIDVHRVPSGEKEVEEFRQSSPLKCLIVPCLQKSFLKGSVFTSIVVPNDGINVTRDE